MRKSFWRIAVVFLFSGTLWADTMENVFLRADLSPANEAPAVVGVTASARATIALHVQRNTAGEVVSGLVDFDVDYSVEQPATLTGLHIHNAGAGANGPIVIDSGVTSVAAQGNGNIFRQVNVSSGIALDALKGILANPANYYVNLHSSVHPGGLMRDQLRVAPPPPPSVSEGGVVNNAGYDLVSSALAPGSIVAVFGTRLTDGTSCLPPSCNPTFGSDGRLGTTMAGAQVTVNGAPVPLFYAARTQLGIQLPVELTGPSATVQVSVAGQSSPARTISIGPFSPGIFTATSDGRGAGAITHANGSLVTSQNPAQPGEVLILYATGLGQITPAVSTGALPSGAATTVTRATVTIGGIPAEVQFSGLSGCCVGLNQINVVVPPGSSSGSALPVVLSVGGVLSNAATLAVGSAPSSNPVPALTSLSPATVDAGSPAQTLTINGSSFVPGSTSTLNGVPKTVTFVSETRLTIQLTANDLATEGSFAVVVTNPPPGGGTSNTLNLSVQIPAPAPPYDY
ncbi:MAG: CHRD domain-containing protein [Acidobacteria bacterium]|nr:CHRD domain-containing protein [Acidobacteriota bacterium]